MMTNVGAPLKKGKMITNVGAPLKKKCGAPLKKRNKKKAKL